MGKEKDAPGEMKTNKKRSGEDLLASTASPPKKARVASAHPRGIGLQSWNSLMALLKKGPNRKKKAFKLGKVKQGKGRWRGGGRGVPQNRPGLVLKPRGRGALPAWPHRSA